MSDQDIGEIRARLVEQGERLARIEERQIGIYRNLEGICLLHSNDAARISSLERLKAHFFLFAAIGGIVFSAAWEIVKHHLIAK
jgi:hypothetical protein